MIIGIGYLAGKEISKDNAIEFLAAIGVNIGAGILMREFTRGLIKFLPVAGNLVSGSMAYAGTIGIGEAAIAYFIDGVSGDEAKKVGEKARKRAEEEGNEEK